ncbi:MAG: hypothetical protein ACWA5T_10345 [Parvularcula sp.]
MRFVAAAVTVSLLAACATGQRLPDPEPVDQSKIEKTEDWKDWGPEQNAKKREAAIAGTRQSASEVKSVFAGRVLRGCYPNGQTFAEYLATDGKFYDAANNNKELGAWGMKQDLLCFRYPERAAQNLPDSCFAIFKNAAGYDFYTEDLSSKVASTTCSK